MSTPKLGTYSKRFQSSATQGVPGRSITQASINNLGELELSFSDGTTSNLGVVVGNQGSQGIQGAVGPTGPVGPQGPAGPAGNPGLNSVNIANTDPTPGLNPSQYALHFNTSTQEFFIWDATSQVWVNQSNSYVRQSPIELSVNPQTNWQDLGFIPYFHIFNKRPTKFAVQVSLSGGPAITTLGFKVEFLRNSGNTSTTFLIYETDVNLGATESTSSSFSRTFFERNVVLNANEITGSGTFKFSIYYTVSSGSRAITANSIAIIKD